MRINTFSRTAAFVSASLLTAITLTACGPDAASNDTMTQGSGTAAETGGSNSAAADQTVAYVYGMSCPLCATNIDKQIARIDGVREASVALDTGRIVVLHEPNQTPSRDAIRSAINESGFTFVRFENE